MPETPIIKSLYRVNYGFRGNVLVWHHRFHFTDVTVLLAVLKHLIVQCGMIDVSIKQVMVESKKIISSK